jgi:hypothetical protein
MTTPRKKPTAKRKSPAKPKAPALIPQPHGGALLTGGVPGHKGAGGRPPSEVRKMLEQGFVEAAPFIARIARGECVSVRRAQCEKCGHEPDNSVEFIPQDVKPGEAVRAWEAQGKFSIGSIKTLHFEGVEGVQRAFDAVRATIRRILEPEQAETLITAIEKDLPGQ